MGNGYEPTYVARAVGSCDGCGKSMKGAGINLGPVTTIGYECCAEPIALLVAEHTPAAESLGQTSESRSRGRRAAAVA